LDDVLIGRNHGVAAVGEKRDTPEASVWISPPSQDDFSVERDFASCLVKEKLASSIRESRGREKVVGDTRGTMSFTCFQRDFVEKEEQSFCCEKSVSFWLHD
jgi:hypothetical protein